MATLLQDAFTDTNGTSLTSHTMTGTPASAWQSHGIVTWTINSNAASETSSASFAAASASSPNADVVLTLDVAVPSASSYALGAAVRLTTGSNFWICAVQRDSGGTPYLHITEYNSATPTQRATTNITGATGTTVGLTVTCSANSITLLASTAETCNYGSATFNNTAIRFGLFSTSGGGYTAGTFDNFLVTGALGLEEGKIPKFGFGAGAIKFAVLGGFSPNPVGGGGTVDAFIPTMGFGSNAGAHLTLLGFSANPVTGGGGSGAFYVFGGAIVR